MLTLLNLQYEPDPEKDIYVLADEVEAAKPPPPPPPKRFSQLMDQMKGVM